ncbi:hypothetical protein [Morganella psychrotolerans]|uniref:Uncharacterized protein n=1 Tax=Morganella psychrotolerans TaxID=368603 RepID=A0A1B8HE77_9GAMM|nr:hypothetical protein [Morganella psychrotolerans]OBU07369.1 hypothetical protein AYY17_05025 [Morganella psychrotolerans]
MRLLTLILLVICFTGHAAAVPLNGYYKCEISPGSYQKTQGALRDYYFTDKQRHAVVLFQENRFIVLDTHPAPYQSPLLVPIQQFAMMSKEDLQEIGEDTLIYAKVLGGLAYFTPSKHRFVFGFSKRGGGNNGAYLLELLNCHKINQ